MVDIEKATLSIVKENNKACDIKPNMTMRFWISGNKGNCGNAWSENSNLILARAWVFEVIIPKEWVHDCYDCVNMIYNFDPGYQTRRSSKATKTQLYELNKMCTIYKGCFAQINYTVASDQTPRR